MYGEARAGLEWTPAEREAYDRVSRLKGEQRAMSLTDSAGGFLVPFELDPAVMITSAGSTNPLLQISRVVSTVTDVWHGVSSAGVVASWDAEASEVSDDSPTLGEPSIPNYKAACFVPFSIEVEGDATTLLSEIGKLMRDGMLQLLNEALTNGSGTGSPTGIITALTGGSSVVSALTPDTLTAADVYAVQSSLGPRWQANARWCANLAILNLLRAMESTNGAVLFPSLQGTQPTLLGRPVHELSNMDGTLGGGAGNDPVLIYGDWENFVISQRIGSAVELIPHLFGANRRPTGQRGMYMYARYGSDSVNDNAFRLLTA
jgi:HK97 family phage major capsid protein